jgi:hypothetical protein
VIRISFQNRFVRYSQSISLKDYQKVICFNFRKTLLSFFLQWKELGTGICSGHVVLGNFEILPILTYYPLLLKLPFSFDALCNILRTSVTKALIGTLVSLECQMSKLDGQICGRKEKCRFSCHVIVD